MHESYRASRSTVDGDVSEEHVDSHRLGVHL